MKMKKAKSIAGMVGEYALKLVSYPVLGALPERSQDWLEEHFESYDKVDATTFSGIVEGFGGIIVGGVIISAINPLAGAVSLLYCVYEGPARAGLAMRAEERRRLAHIEDVPLMRSGLAMEAEKSVRPPEVYGSLIAKIIATPMYYAYDNLAGPTHRAYDKILEKFGKNKE